MNRNEISVDITRPIGAVSLTIDPNNTPKWIDDIVKEQASELPIRVGTRYKNVGRRGKWSYYTVTAFKTNSLFELESKDGRYHVRYEYKEVTPVKTRLTYREWVDRGDLKAPFKQDVLEKLKLLMEGRKS